MSERIGRYELERPLATGERGAIYLGRATGGEVERHVVVKTIDVAGKDAGKLFDDVRRAGMFHHQHIARVIDAGREGDRAFVAMDYVHGRTARDIWQQAFMDGVLLPIDFALSVVAAAASALHYVHTRKAADGIALKLVHGEVSLGNVIVGFDGSIQLIGFVSAHRAFNDKDFTKAHVAYLSPEQARRQPLDGRSDVFSLGIVLYELSTMRRAFRDDSDRLTIERVKSGAYAKPSAIRGTDYPAEVERIIAKALRVDPAERYPDADTMRRDIEAAARHLDVVLGDAAIVEVMEQLFAERREPWALPSGQRFESFSDLRAEFDGPSAVGNDAPFVETPRKLRAGTESVDAFAIESEMSADEFAADTAAEGEPVSERPSNRAKTVLGTPVPPRRPAGKDTDGIPVHPSAHLPIPQPTDVPVAAKALPIRHTDRRRLAIIIGAGVGIGIVIALAVAMRGGSEDRKKKASDAAVTMMAVDAPVVIDASVAGVVVDAAPMASVDASTVPLDAAVVLRDAAAHVDAATRVAAADAAGHDATVDAAPTGPTILVRVTTNPPGATVELDQKRLGKTPYEGRVEAVTGGTHNLKIRLSGFNVVRVPVDLSADVTQDIELKKALPVDAGTDDEPKPSTDLVIPD